MMICMWKKKDNKTLSTVKLRIGNQSEWRIFTVIHTNTGLIITIPVGSITPHFEA